MKIMGCIDRKKIIKILILICVMQLVLALFWAEKKSYLFMDELFSYASANRVEGVEAELPANQWLDELWLLDYVTADAEHTFEYAIPYGNQATDVHPPLFYLFLHTACSMIPEQFSYWAGTGCNIIFFIASTIALYFLAKELLKDNVGALLAAFLYSISYGGLNTMAFIRMYMLLTLIVILHTYVYLKYFEQESIPLKGYIYLGITVVLGMLTQYYFAIIAFFYGVWYAVTFLCKKQYQKLIKYISTAAVSAACSLAIYPTMWKHIFSTSRGVEARENFVSSEGYLQKLLTMWRLMDSQLFTNLFLAVAVVLIVLAVLVWKKGDKAFDRAFTFKIGAMFSACLLYFMVVTKIAPYQIDRYVMPIYPLVYLMVIGAMYLLLKKIVCENKAVVLCVLGFGGLSIVHMLYSNIPHTYSEDIIITPRLEIAEEYQDHYAVYIGKREKDIPKYYDILQVLSKYRGYYYIDGTTDISKNKEDMEIMKNESSVVVYVDDNIKTKEVFELFWNLFEGKSTAKDNVIHRDEGWIVYLVDIE